jgi:pimeloyl-ACP methyl ester carboxylesterase
MNRALALFLIPLVLELPLRAVRAQAADGPNSRSFDAKGVKIRYLNVGKGEPVVLIHGLHSSAEINWGLTGVIRDLARDHRVIALDLPGHGRSDRPEDDAAYGLQLVEDVVLLLDHVQIKKVHVVGYSLGGMVALKLVAAHPDRVSSAAIGGMGWFREGSGLQRLWDRLPAREGSRTPTAFIRNVGKLALTEQELRKIATPVKVVVGDRDPVKPLYVAPLRRKRADWPVVEIDDAGHIDCIIKKQFRDEVTGWVRSNSGRDKR